MATRLTRGIFRLNGHTYVTREAKSSTASESIDCLWSPAPLTTEFEYTWTTNGSTMSTSTALSSDEHVNAYGIYIRWQSSDLSSISPTTPATNTATTTGNTATTTTAAATSTSTETPASSSGSSGLSTGAKAGIGVGVAVGGIIILALLGLLFVRRRRGRTTQSQAQYNANDTNGAVLSNQPPSEMPSECAHEMPTEYMHLTPGTLKELPAEGNVPELEGTKK